ncbi:MAG: heparinase II/III family protein [Bacteroidales bacterium]|nr:heparinase II/III family protein [Bacteroidales bacterium]
MKRFTIIALLLSFALSYARAYEERNIFMNSATPQEVKESLVMDQKWVKYPAYTDRAGWDAIFGQYKDHYITAGEKLLDFEWKVVRATDYLAFERSGNRSVMEGRYYNNVGTLGALFLAEMAEGKGRFIDPMIDGIFLMCEMTSWSANAHVVQQRTKRALPTNLQPVLDLREAEMGQLMSWIYYFMKDELDKVDPEISRRMRQEIKAKVLDPYLNDSFNWMARKAKGTKQNNWNPWCNGNALLSFMLMENDRDTLAKVVLESMRSVDQYVNYITFDGACDEGPRYWNLAGGKLYDYVEILKLATGGKVNLLSHPYLKRTGEYICNSYIGLDWVVNFADAPAKGGVSPFLIYRFGKAVGSEKMKHFAAALFEKKVSPPRFYFSGNDLFRLFEALSIKDELASASPEAIVEPFVWYPETEFCYLSDPEGLFVAAKGGHNNESHNHNDVGSFILYMDNQPVLIDAGVGYYTRQTFTSERYTIWTMQSNYHNLPVINGFGQKNGAAYKASEAMAKPNFFSVNIAGAYPAEAKVEKWTRSYQLAGKELKVNDSFKLKETVAPNSVSFMTWGNVKKESDGKISISVEGVNAQLTYDPKIFDCNIETIALTDHILSDVWGDKVYRLSFTAKKLAKSGKYSFTVTKR